MYQGTKGQRSLIEAYRKVPLSDLTTTIAQEMRCKDNYILLEDINVISEY